MTIIRAGALAAAVAAACLEPIAAAQAVERTTETVNGVKADVFTWLDYVGYERSVALKKEGSGNKGHGGYAVQMRAGEVGPELIANAPKGDGFGYFVSHERYRTFKKGDDGTIAQRIFGEDDSPLGLNFPVKTKFAEKPDGTMSVTYSLIYHHYGTKKPNGFDADNGRDKPRLGLSKDLFKRYDLPVTITWSFQDGYSYPRVRTVVDLSKLPGPDRVSFDLRGPYGKLDFDGGNNPINQVMWGDRFKFENTTTPLTRNSQWTWNQFNTSAARYNALLARNYEMGLLEPRPYAQSAINDGYSSGRGKTSDTYNPKKAGCAGQVLPCDYEWPYQSSQYELSPKHLDEPTTSEKLAWGSTAYYGMKSVKATYDGVDSTPFKGFPGSGKIVYDTCVVIGKPIFRVGLTRYTAEQAGDYDCTPE